MKFYDGLLNYSKEEELNFIIKEYLLALLGIVCENDFLDKIHLEKSQVISMGSTIFYNASQLIFRGESFLTRRICNKSI